MITKGVWSSVADDWGTPQKLFDELNEEFGFTLDACANEHNFKVANYFDIERDSLTQVWDGVVWMNPPYGRTIKLWMKKAYESSLEGATVVCLVPARTDTGWWHDYAVKGSEIRFLRGRIRFEKVGMKLDNAPFPSAIVVFKNVSSDK